jgi:hypothetical protein
MYRSTGVRTEKQRCLKAVQMFVAHVFERMLAGSMGQRKPVRFLGHLSVLIRQRSAARVVHWVRRRSSDNKRNITEQESVPWETARRRGAPRGCMFVDAVCYACAKIAWENVFRNFRYLDCDVKAMLHYFPWCVLLLKKYCLLFRWHFCHEYVLFQTEKITLHTYRIT